MPKNTKNTALAQTKQVGKFGLVGIINTLLDFGVYNIMFSLVGLKPIPANLIAATVAMTFSFIANKRFVFDQKAGSVLRQAALFLLVTATALYVIQNIVIYGLTELWLWPLELAYDIVGSLGLSGALSQEFVVNNGAKAIATGFSMVWNYLLYKKVVFKK